MARPVKADAEATKRRILSVAAALFSAKGAARTSMREIGKAAGVSMATVHHYFGGKSGLYRACVEATYAELDALRTELEGQIDRYRREDPTMASFIDMAVRRTYAFSRKHRHVAQIVMRNVLETGELETDKREHYLLPLLESGAEILAPIVGQPLAKVRLIILSLNYLITRYTLNSDRELAVVLGMPEASPEEAVKTVEDYLVSSVIEQLYPGERS
jgi:AcrR family transcriptional regulator